MFARMASLFSLAQSWFLEVRCTPIWPPSYLATKVTLAVPVFLSVLAALLRLVAVLVLAALLAQAFSLDTKEADLASLWLGILWMVSLKVLGSHLSVLCWALLCKLVGCSSG
jgi:hypothetical protein